MRFVPISVLGLALAALPATAQAPADSARVYALAEVEGPPRPTNVDELRAALDVAYPAELRAAGRGARVSVAFVVGADGVPRDFGVASSTDAAFDSATIATIAILRFTPATVGGSPVPVRVEVPVQWQPDAPPPPASAAAAQATSAETAPDGSVAYELTQVRERPRPRNESMLRAALQRDYPTRMRQMRVSATVHVRFLIDEEGRVVSPRVTRSTRAEFDAPTLEVIQVLQFTPGTIAGRPVKTWVELPIQWTP
jgi:TonB family protein